MPDTSIFDHSCNSTNDRIPEHGGKKRKIRLFSKTGGSPNPEPAAPKEWIIPGLERWSIDWSSHLPTTTLYEPSVRSTVRDLPMCLRVGIQASEDHTASYQGRFERRSYRSSGSWLDLSPESTEPATPHCKTEHYLQGLPPVKTGRFYRTTSLKRQLAGPEDYVSWADEMQTKLSQINAWPIIEEDMDPVPRDSKYHTRWAQLNNEAWLLLITNVSRPIRRDLCASWAWDTRGSWSYLREKYGGFAATMTRSVQGVHDMTSLRYEDCASLSEFCAKMKSCIRAIESTLGQRGRSMAGFGVGLFWRSWGRSGSRGFLGI